MGNKITNTSNRIWTRIVLAVVLCLIVAFSFFGEKVALGPGIGWDGANYWRSMQHFIHLVKIHGYDQYEIMRVMPWGLTDIMSAIFGFSVTREVAVSFGIIYNAIAMVIAVLYYFRISNYRQWKLTTEILGFSFLFFTYPVLKNMGYYPLLSDTFGLTLGIMMCYYFLVEKRWALILCGFAGTFIWPTSPLVAFALAFFPQKALPTIRQEDTKTDHITLSGLFWLFACIPLIILIITMMQYDGQIMEAMREICPMTIARNQWIALLSCACACAYYYYIVSAIKVSPISTLKENFTGKGNWVNYGWFILCLLVSKGMCHFLANSNPGALTTLQTIQLIPITSMTDPFVFIESHFIYYGIGYLLVLLLWKDIAKIIMQQGLGYLFVVALWVLFSIRPEARVCILFYVFAIIALLMHLDSKNIRMSATYITTIFMLIHSRFWYRINVPGIAKAFEWENHEQYVDFPAQRYFMSMGHWQSHEMYAVWMVVTAIIGVLLYAGIRKKWFILDKQ